MGQTILKKIQDLRKEDFNLIGVSNSEWYSLFKDEIRNSIAIEGVFANRNDLLDVLERNKGLIDKNIMMPWKYVMNALKRLIEKLNRERRSPCKRQMNIFKRIILTHL